jgi:cytochrome c oxidase subunit III
VLALPPAPPPARPRMLLVGTALAAAGLVMLVTGQLGVYLHVREAAGGTTATWLPRGVKFNEVAANIMLITMGCLCVMAQWSVYAMRRGDRRNAAYALVLVVLFGIAVLNAQVFIWIQLDTGFADSQFGTLVYLITGTFFAALCVGLVMAGVMAFRSLGGRYSPKDTEGLSATALYIYVLTVVFAAVWLLVYVLK